MLTRRQTLSLAAPALAAPLFAAGLSAPALAAGVLRVAYAGAMGAVMDRGVGPAFAKQAGVSYQGIGQAAFALAHLLVSRQLQADVFVPITAPPFEIVRRAGLAPRAVPVAGTEMCIAYSPKSRFAKLLEAAAAGHKPWYEVLRTPGLRFGRTDPRIDPQGQNILFTLLLAERYYHQPGLARALLGPVLNPAQIFTEPSLLARLDAGQIDASSGYLSAVRSQHLPFIPLPKEINLGDPAEFDPWYSKVHARLKMANGKAKTVSPQPLVFYAAALTDAATPALAARFVDFLAGAEGQKIFATFGYGPPRGPVLSS